MNIEAFLLCDCATDSQGKLNVLGAFDSIYAKQVPVVYPACTIAARIRFSKIEEGQHSIRINVIDEDGREVAPRLENKISVKAPDGVDSSVVNLILNLQRLKLEDYGEYRIDLAIDNRLEGSLPFSVRKVPYRH
ncbi:MAG: hypothetical protein JSV82_07205 [Planctomycetota bacterium]|nr:MAG: hypothetical protein JSV82_07205 [Planctomycetota bacterium]